MVWLSWLSLAPLEAASPLSVHIEEILINVEGEGEEEKETACSSVDEGKLLQSCYCLQCFFLPSVLLGKTLVSLPSPLFVALMTKCGSHRCPRVEEAIITSGDYVTLCPRDGLVSCEALASHIGLIQA